MRNLRTINSVPHSNRISIMVRLCISHLIASFWKARSKLAYLSLVNVAEIEPVVQMLITQQESHLLQNIFVSCLLLRILPRIHQHLATSRTLWLDYSGFTAMKERVPFCVYSTHPRAWTKAAGCASEQRLMLTKGAKTVGVAVVRKASRDACYCQQTHLQYWQSQVNCGFRVSNSITVK